jgi:hypothetical protein
MYLSFALSRKTFAHSDIDMSAVARNALTSFGVTLCSFAI